MTSTIQIMNYELIDLTDRLKASQYVSNGNLKLYRYQKFAVLRGWFRLASSVPAFAHMQSFPDLVGLSGSTMCITDNAQSFSALSVDPGEGVLIPTATLSNTSSAYNIISFVLT